MRYAIEGATRTGTLDGDGERAPFYIFDIEEQDWLNTAYATRDDAEDALTVLRYRNAVKRAKEDHAEHVGRVLRADWVNGYRGEHSAEVRCVPPALVRVLPTDADSLARDTGDWLDPYWDVELVVPHPMLEGLRSLWIYGTSYPLYEDREPEAGRFTVVEGPTIREALQDLLSYEMEATR